MEDIIYNFYPKDIDALEMVDLYINSKQYKNLSNQIKLIKTNNKNSINELINEIKNIERKFTFNDCTLFDWEDRCYNFHLTEIINNKMNKIHINISAITSIYFLFITQNRIDINGKYVNVPTRKKDLEENEYAGILKKISTIIETHFKYKKFEEEYVYKIIPDVNFQDIELGKFTFYNAFFLNELT